MARSRAGSANLTTAMVAFAAIHFCGSLMTTMQLAESTASVQKRAAHGEGHQRFYTSKCRSSSKCCSKCTAKNITVYNYLSVQGPSSTAGYNAVECGQSGRTQPNRFGDTFCFDMPLLAEQDLNSTLLGVVQGTYVFVSLSPPPNSLFVAETFTLNTSAFPQGTFSASGIENIGEVSAKPITGGTGDFAFLTGIAVTTPLSSSVDSNGNLVAFFNYVFTFRPADCKE